MPVTRTALPNMPIDKLGAAAHLVEGTNKADKYTTQGGDHEAFFLHGNDRITLDGGYVYPDSGALNLSIHLGAGNDRLTDRNDLGGETVNGNAGNDRITIGGGGDGTQGSGAFGGDGNDVLRSLGGGNGNALYGNRGNDVLYTAPNDPGITNGGPGRDTFHLSEGENLLQYFAGHSGTAATAGKPDERDVIRGFDAQEDTIALSGIDARPDEGHQSFTWIGQATTENPLDPGEVGWFAEGKNDVVVAWIDGGGARQAIVLDNFAPQAGQLDATDFLL